jgi:hypothetical protein
MIAFSNNSIFIALSFVLFNIGGSVGGIIVGAVWTSKIFLFRERHLHVLTENLQLPPLLDFEPAFHSH